MNRDIIKWKDVIIVSRTMKKYFIPNAKRKYYRALQYHRWIQQRLLESYKYGIQVGY